MQPFGLSALVVLSGLNAGHGSQSQSAARTQFQQFVKKHGRNYLPGSSEYAERRALFEQHTAAVEAHNRRPNRSWTAGFSRLADRTDEELSALRGYTHGASPQQGAGGASTGRRVSFLSRSQNLADQLARPDTFTWKDALRSFDEVLDQSSCGACWAVATSKVLRAHSEIYFKDRTYSIEQLLSCTPNPRHCGGTGGCDGATSALALEYAAEAGVVEEEAWEYDLSNPTTESCPKELVVQNNSQQILRRGRGFGMTGWKQLAENKLSAVMDALFTKGPLTVAIAAGTSWNMYASGILESCEADAIINHAVVLIGYGISGQQRWWHIMNSWGSSWGEDGFLRLERHEDDAEENYCGWDTAPQEGNGCDGGPDKVWVCGSCGLLYDTNMPIFEANPNSLYDMARGDTQLIVRTQKEKRQQEARSPPMRMPRMM